MQRLVDRRAALRRVLAAACAVLVPPTLLGRADEVIE